MSNEHTLVCSACLIIYLVGFWITFVYCICAECVMIIFPWKWRIFSNCNNVCTTTVVKKVKKTEKLNLLYRFIWVNEENLNNMFNNSHPEWFHMPKIVLKCFAFQKSCHIHEVYGLHTLKLSSLYICYWQSKTEFWCL